VKIVWLPTARATRQKAIDYIAADNVSAALDQLERIERRVDSLADFPDQGRVGRQHRTRELVVPRTPFIIVYRVRKRPPRVEIMRVLHGKQKLPR
jgi:toxin ParE1/3/4